MMLQCVMCCQLCLWFGLTADWFFVIAADFDSWFRQLVSERSLLLAPGCCEQSVVALFGHLLSLFHKHCLPSVVQESLMPLVDNMWSFLNAWHHLWRPFMMPRCFGRTLGVLFGVFLRDGLVLWLL